LESVHFILHPWPLQLRSLICIQVHKAEKVACIYLFHVGLQHNASTYFIYIYYIILYICKSQCTDCINLGLIEAGQHFARRANPTSYAIMKHTYKHVTAWYLIIYVLSCPTYFIACYIVYLPCFILHQSI
jgi:hypothetical protein